MLLRDLEVRAFVTRRTRPARLGAMALFGEKYGDAVRVVEVGDYAARAVRRHARAALRQLGMVKLLGEASIGSGVRRVEALVGLDAFRYLAREHVLVPAGRGVQGPARRGARARRRGPERLRDAERELEKLRAAAVLSRPAARGRRRRGGRRRSSSPPRRPAGVAGNDLRALASTSGPG